MWEGLISLDPLVSIPSNGDMKMEFVQKEGFIMARTIEASDGKQNNNIDVVVDVMVLHYNIYNFLKAKLTRYFR
jgi:hypothetical protein